MLDLFNLPTPQGCDIKTFNANNVVGAAVTTQTWVKPRGVSNVYMLLIGAGGTGTVSAGGGSGAVTVWYGSALNVPDILNVSVSRENDTRIQYRGSGGLVTLVEAYAASTVTGGPALAGNQFVASGFFQSIVGQGGAAGAQTPATTTFLSGGGSTAGVTSNYGYSIGNSTGRFQMQPIIVGVGGAGTNFGGIGCGGGLAGGAVAKGGPGFALIASW